MTGCIDKVQLGVRSLGRMVDSDIIKKYMYQRVSKCNTQFYMFSYLCSGAKRKISPTSTVVT